MVHGMKIVPLSSPLWGEQNSVACASRACFSKRPFGHSCENASRLDSLQKPPHKSKSLRELAALMTRLCDH
jgi:hypothetical protein